ncbi:MAG: putative RNA 2'-phosphotransferase, partial [Gammaproteobacteria bacterium]
MARSKIGGWLVATRKCLILILRHGPEAVGLSPDASGWVDVDVRLEAVNQRGRAITREHLEQAVVSNEIQRFVIRDGKIRANQGHSFAVELGLLATPALDEVYHGAVERFLTAIMRDG